MKWHRKKPESVLICALIRMHGSLSHYSFCFWLYTRGILFFFFLMHSVGYFLSGKIFERSHSGESLDGKVLFVLLIVDFVQKLILPLFSYWRHTKLLHWIFTYKVLWWLYYHVYRKDDLYRWIHIIFTFLFYLTPRIRAWCKLRV